MVAPKNLLSFSCILLIAQLYACGDRTVTVRVNEDLLDKSLNRPMRKMGFVLMTMAEDIPDSSLYRQIYHEIKIDLEVAIKRAQAFENGSVQKQLQDLYSSFEKVYNYYDRKCAQRGADCSTVRENIKSKF